MITSPDWYQGKIGFIVDDDGRTPCPAAVMRIDRRFLQFRPPTWQVSTPITFDRAPGSGGIWHELVYTGISRSTIRITHREYTAREPHSLAREAFYLDLEYDLSKSDGVLSFRDIDIAVKSADSERIVFVVTGP